ncbi:MAG: 23S rRNA (adenine(2503)-C(2))-methyltransferase RlmN [Calditrichaeota bacterium]|nr:23S rRNA (adenine(2503)-C(2))-methyltransferase RlmN [Calditrichota bacterium]
MKNILNLSAEELETYFKESGEPKYRARQVYQGVFQKAYEDFAEFTNLSKALRQKLAQDFTLRSFKELDRITSPIDQTTKLLWQLPDGLKIEGVIIYEGKRVTFCISSQVGCALDCKFCATGKMGWLRDLTAGEIVEQVLQMKKLALRPPTNIVFMGMGEPLLNYDEVMRAAEILADEEGVNFSRKKITVSTSGIIPGIRRMAEENQPFKLAVSLNASDQNKRERVMPVARKYPLSELMKAAGEYYQKTRKRITFEYVLIAGFNDSAEDARNLVKITRRIPCKINIIPVNSEDPEFSAPSPESVARFEQAVQNSVYAVTVRNRKGWDIRAACGMLYASNEKTRVSAKRKGRQTGCETR